MPRSAFETWFRAQYGKRPHRLSEAAARDRCFAAQLSLAHAECVLYEVRAWTTKRDVALKAWQAKEGN